MIPQDQNYFDMDLREVQRLKFIEKSIRTKIQMLCEYHCEVSRQIMHLDKDYQIQSIGSILGDIQRQIEQENMIYNNNNQTTIYEDKDMNFNYEQDKEDFNYKQNKENDNMLEEEEDEDEEEDYDDEDLFQGQTEQNLPGQNNLSLFENQSVDKNQNQADANNLFPKLMRKRKLNCYRNEPKKKRVSTLIQSKKMYPFKKMKPLPSDEPAIVCQKLAMKDKYDKFLKKLQQEMPYYISDYGQIRYPIYIKKKVAFFCRYISRAKLVEDTRIGAEAVSKWVKVYSDYMDDKLENGEPNETFEEYFKQKQTKSAYIIKKQQLNCQPNLNHAILKQVQPALWHEQQSYQKACSNSKNKYKFKKS